MTEQVLVALAWSLAHSLWQHGLLAAVLWWMLRRLAGATSSHRYLLSCGALLLAAALPILTFSVLVLRNSPPPTSVEPTQRLAVAWTSEPPMNQSIAGETGSPSMESTPSDSTEAIASVLTPRFVKALVLCYLLGVFLFGLRFAGGWVYLQHLRWAGVRAPEPEWRRRLEELAPRLKVFRPVWLYESRRVAVPTLIGWLRPVILLPVGMLTGLTPQQVEAVLAHELAHVRRHDYLVNLLQSLAEVFYYYSPGVWVLSRMIREEREYCCDDLAVAATGSPLALGRALAELEILGRPPAVKPALAATGGKLLHRVRRLLVPAPKASVEARTLFAPVLGLAVVVLALLPVRGVRGIEIFEEFFEPFTPATHDTYQKGRRPITLQGEAVPLREVVRQIRALTGVVVTFPAEAENQLVSVDFENVTADTAIVSIFNLLEMDHYVNAQTGHIETAYWPGSGPRADVPRLSLAYFHARQNMFRGFKHSLRWTSVQRMTLGEGLRRLTEIGGMTFVLTEPGLADLPVEVHIPQGTVRDALHAMLRHHNLHYAYTDDSRVRIER